MKNDHNIMNWHILLVALIKILISKIHQFGEYVKYVRFRRLLETQTGARRLIHELRFRNK